MENLKNQQEQLKGKDEYAFLDDSELEALKNLLNANAVNEFIALNDSHYDLEKRLENYDNQQQTIADGVVKDLFGVSGKEFQDIKSAIADLQKGELIIKDNTMSELGLGGKKYKKMKVTRLI